MSPGVNRLSIARIATETPMGAQAYEAQVISRAAQAMGPAWEVRELVFRSMRSALPGNRRLPMGRVATASPALRRQIGRMLFAGDAVSHRTSLELPPAPRGDVITLHDVVAWRFDDESAPVPAAMEEARTADAVICVSEFTAGEAVRFLGVRDPHVVPNGVDPRYFAAEPLGIGERAALGIPGPYVLHAGGAAERKNLAALAEAWPAVHREHPELTLALAGPPHPRRTELFDGMPGAVLLGRLPDAAMPGLVAAADAVVVPSLYEGFGLPALEAMAAGTPVVAASTSSLPEVVGDAGMLVQPTGAGIAAGLQDLLADSAAATELIARGRERSAEYTWERSAAGHAAVWKSL